MLGKVFENLLEVKDRKSKGAFYTPRHIVHYICQENLISYLNTNSGLSEEDLREFIINGDLAINSIIRAHEEKKKYKGRQYTRIELPESIEKNSDELEKLLKRVKVIDPAVGSGAFPVGMMNEIVKARYILRLLNDIEDVNMYDLKRETIENSLYGVDLELSATDVTKLRFWLSLIVDKEDIKHIKPLPNLDNQIMCGNSVIDGFNNIKLFDDTLIVRSEQTRLSMTPTERAFNELESKKKEFFNTSGPLRKEELKNEIKALKWNFIETYLKDLGKSELIEEIREFKYAESKPFFIWELEFSEIFKGKNPGFDIVVGNPPYVRQEKIKDIKPYLKENYNTFSGLADLYVYFIEKSMNLLKENGSLSFICSNKFSKAKYGLKIREFMLNYQLVFYDDHTGDKIFDSAQVDSCVFLLKKSFKEDNKVLVDKSYYVSQSLLNPEALNFEKEEVHNLIYKINSMGKQLKDIDDIKINYGIKTGLDKAFIIDEETKNYLISLDDKNKEIIKPVLRGRDVRKGKIYFKNLYLIFSRQGINIDEYPTIKEYLSQYKAELTPKTNSSQKVGRKAGYYKWYELQDTIAYYEDFDQEKLIYPNMASSLFTVFDDSGYYVNPKCFFIITNKIDLKYLSALLSSNVLNFIFKYMGSPLGNSLYDIHKHFVEKLPIVSVDKEKWEPISNMTQTYFELNKKYVDEVNNFYNLLENVLNIDKLSKKLEKYYELSPNQFLNELKKKKVNVEDQNIKNNLLNEFNNNLKNLNKIDGEIKLLDVQINNLIYPIYELTEEEIEIIENSLND